MTLPKWIEDLRSRRIKNWQYKDVALLEQALEIAWEALENGSRHMKFTDVHTHDKFDEGVFRKAMRRIASLGDSQHNEETGK